jgi:hypothetical protein
MIEGFAGRADVSVSHVKKGRNGAEKVISFDSTSEEFYNVPFFEEGTKPATVSLGMEYSRQIRQFEPVKISVHVSMPCHADVTSINKCYDIVNEIVESKMSEAKKSIDAIVNKNV